MFEPLPVARCSWHAEPWVSLLHFSCPSSSPALPLSAQWIWISEACSNTTCKMRTVLLTKGILLFTMKTIYALFHGRAEYIFCYALHWGLSEQGSAIFGNKSSSQRFALCARIRHKFNAWRKKMVRYIYMCVTFKFYCPEVFAMKWESNQIVRATSQMEEL